MTPETYFYEMLRIRRIEEAIASRYSEQKMRCPTHLSIGQEAIAVGVSAAINKEDLMVSNHRAHAHYLAKGGDLKTMIAEIHGKKTGCSMGRGGSMHLVDRSVGFVGSTPIVAGSIPIGVGLAFASSLKQDDLLTVTYMGEAATEEGVFAESLNFASLKKLPVLFVCENNLYSVYSPLSVRQSKERDLVKIAEGHGIFSQKGNGNDVEETLTLAKEAVHHIRNGNGPAFLLLDTYRFREHCGPNFDTDLPYRTIEEFSHWLEKCPIKTYQKQFTEDTIQEMEEKIKKEVDEAFSFAEESPLPEFDLDYELTYAE
ncbi:thiamine pyrophosphate-dependent dehydrogenase E1 component subunit alpha [Candidatus Neptunochlamydia vexilliferae]|uniref:Pyruvate dehydrogenase E1 component subunit alpha n=1 Tax=Candidatus Neptunichlamydia vexilliferae TaxID=1651774 RepID=A0ABS0AYK5_9BACT|nr:thiamine pyrophosphate-dependent dehydrogenase E1 component subunit alpha [Candidatus Neptunochlamydia vexilliferae]MBF5059049.1 Pyruvate dehydrogenase E1 component subunit alpha [Candidatus Neptunochlamydia vexilliferae]